MLPTSTAAKVFAVVASGVLHAAAFAAAAPRDGPNRGGELDLEIPLVVENAEDVPVQPPLPELPQARPVPASAPLRSSPRGQVSRSASELHASVSEPHASASAAVSTAESPPAIGRSSDDELPRFAMVLRGAAGPRDGARESRLQDASAQGGDPILPVDEVTAPARLLVAALPRYPIQARANGIEADVKLEVVVDAAGGVQSTRVLGAPRRGFDEAALDAVANYRFAPATLKGRPVRVRMKWTVEFRLN